MASFGTFTGNLDALTRFGTKLAAIGNQRFLTKLNQDLAKEAIIQARDGFREERDPYGKKWPRKVFPDGRKILRKSDGLYNGFHVVSANGVGFLIGNREPHAKFTFGTGIYGPSKQRIYPRTAKALRVPGPAARGLGGRFKSGAMFFSSVAGAPPRLIVPVKGRVSMIWQKALKRRAASFLSQHFSKKS